jgi:O-methyltransferase
MTIFTAFSQMNLSVYDIINYIFLLIALLFAIRFIWYHIQDKRLEPVLWQIAHKKKQLPAGLLKSWRMYHDKIRFYNFWIQVNRLKNEQIIGDFAELGVYKGDSARIIHFMDPGRIFHLFDTFSGFAAEDLKVETGEASTYTSLNFSDTDPESVLKFIGGNTNIKIHQGYFPEITDNLDEATYALVNMDADLYNPTRAGLAYFYRRLAPGGVILIHDYNNKWPGIMKAVDEFSKEIPEVPILVPDIDGTIMIIRNK